MLACLFDRWSGSLWRGASGSVGCSAISCLRYIPYISTYLKPVQHIFWLFDVLPPAGTRIRQESRISRRTGIGNFGGCDAGMISVLQPFWIQSCLQSHPYVLFILWDPVCICFAYQILCVVRIDKVHKTTVIKSCNIQFHSLSYACPQLQYTYVNHILNTTHEKHNILWVLIKEGNSFGYMANMFPTWLKSFGL